MMRRPVITEERMQVYLTREGDRATGSVEFPHATRGRVVVPIDYRRTDPPPAPARLSPSLPGRGQGEGAAGTGRPAVALSARAAQRLEAVQLADQMAAAFGPRSRGAGLAKAVEILKGKGFDCTARSIQLWARRLDLHGPQGLEDDYTPRPTSVLGISGDTAQKALTVLGWWCYQVGNLPRIDSSAMHVAAVLIGDGWTPADLMVVINCYASWGCDRQVMPFKAWHRWARYDLDRWALRAGVRGDKLRAKAHTAPPPDASTRRRQVNSTTAQKALAARAARDGVAEAPSRLARSALDPCGTGLLPGASCGTGVSPVACGTGVSPVVDAGPPGPATVADGLLDLDDRWRSMLLSAAHGDRHALDQAAETIAFWWGKLPESVTGPIDMRTAAWAKTHPGVAPAAVARRRVQALAPQLLGRGSGLPTAGIAARAIRR